MYISKGREEVKELTNTLLCVYFIHGPMNEMCLTEVSTITMNVQTYSSNRNMFHFN